MHTFQPFVDPWVCTRVSLRGVDHGRRSSLGRPHDHLAFGDVACCRIVSSDRWTLAEERDVRSLVVPRAGSFERLNDPLEPGRIVDVDGSVDQPAAQFARHLVACDYSPHTSRAYLRSLLLWYRFLHAIDVPWNQAERRDVRDFVLWLKVANNPQRRAQRLDGTAPGAINPITGKRTLGAGYAKSTVNHALTSMKMFYEYHLVTGLGPVVNPVPEQRSRDLDRPGSHRSPMEKPSRLRRAPYRQRSAIKEPRALTNELFNEFFAALPSNRDRAIVSLGVSSGPRAAEVLDLHLDQIDVGRQIVLLQTKGRSELEEVPTSPDAFLWLAAYLAETEEWRPAADTRVWWTLRRPVRPMTYSALRQVLNRANTRIGGANITFHDLRHTYCMRMLDDPNLLITDVQRLMRHASILSTQIYSRAEIDDLVRKMQAHYNRPTPSEPTVDPGYDPAAISVLFPDLV